MGLQEAVMWLRTNQLPCGALPVSSVNRNPYPEVTAYCLPTLSEVGEHQMVERAVIWLLQVQTGDGYWPGSDMTTPFWFDTAVVAGSLLSLASREESYAGSCRRAVIRAVSWLERYCGPSWPPVRAVHHDRQVPQEINLLGLTMLKEFPRLSSSLDRWLSDSSLPSSAGKMQHFYCYLVEAIADVKPGWAWRIAGRYARAQDQDGAVCAYYTDRPSGRVIGTTTWRCFPAVAQWAALWARLGYPSAARRALAFLEARQRLSGGLTGGDGPYFADEEVTWALKYYLDAHLRLAEADTHCRTQRPMDRVAARGGPACAS